MHGVRRWIGDGHASGEFLSRGDRFRLDRQAQVEPMRIGLRGADGIAEQAGREKNHQQRKTFQRNIPRESTKC